MGGGLAGSRKRGTMTSCVAKNCGILSPPMVGCHLGVVSILILHRVLVGCWWWFGVIVGEEDFKVNVSFKVC